jgi:hypothetical protein
MSKLLLIILGIFLVLATINSISALPVACPTGQIPENDQCVPVPIEKRDFIEETYQRNSRTVVQTTPTCRPGYYWAYGKCRPL